MTDKIQNSPHASSLFCCTGESRLQSDLQRSNDSLDTAQLSESGNGNILAIPYRAISRIKKCQFSCQFLVFVFYMFAVLIAGFVVLLYKSGQFIAQ